MPQVARQMKHAFLKMLPERVRLDFLERHPNLRKAAPVGLQLRFNRYLGEFTVNIDTRFPAERKMWSGNYDRALQQLLRSWIRPQSVCFDIGANVGAVTLAMAQALHGGPGRVYAFEPAPPTFARLEANLALNSSVRDRVTAVNLGLGDQPGVLHWTEEQDNLGNGSLLGANGLEVSVTTVDEFCARHGLDRGVEVMKIDVESMEYEVLRGAAGVLRRDRPKLYFETMARSKTLRGADIFQKIEAFLRELGFDLFKLARDGRLVPTTADGFVNNTIALPRAV